MTSASDHRRRPAALPRLFAAVLAPLFALALAAAPAPAQPGGGGFAFDGEITSIDPQAGSFQIFDFLSVTTTDSTQYLSAETGQDLEFSNLAVGQHVHVEGELPAGTDPNSLPESIVATFVLVHGDNNPPPPPPGDFVAAGMVTFVDHAANSFGLDHFLVTVDAATSYENFPTDALGLQNVAPGQFLEVEGELLPPAEPNPDGDPAGGMFPFPQERVHAARVTLLDNGGGPDCLLRGAITDIQLENADGTPGGLVFIDNAPVSVDPSLTLVFDENGAEASLDGLAVGDFVEALLALTFQGPPLALEIHQLGEVPPPPPLEIVFEGHVHDLDHAARSFRAGGFLVNATDDTEYLNFPTEVPPSFETLAEGQRVEVLGLLSGFPTDPANGGMFPFETVTALSVTYLGEGGGGMPFPVFGQVTATQFDAANAGGFFTLDHHMEIGVTNNTEVVLFDGTSAGPEAIQPGQFVEALVNHTPSGLLAAIRVQILDDNPPPPDDLTIQGLINEIDEAGQSLLVADNIFGVPGGPPSRLWTVFTDADTTYSNDQGEALAFSDLAPNQFVLVTGEPVATAFGDPGSGFGFFALAHEIVVLAEGPPPPPPLEFITGILNELHFDASGAGPSGAVIGQQNVALSNNTLVFLPDGMNGGVGDLAIGQFVEARVDPMTASPIPFALEIHILDDGPPPPPDVVIAGQVTDLGGAFGEFQLDFHFTVETSDMTEFLDFPTDLVGFDNLSLGQTVEVAGVFVLPPNDPANPDGTVPPLPERIAAHSVRFLHHGGPSTVTVEGEILSIGPGDEMLISSLPASNGWQILLTSATEFFGPDGPISFSDLEQGDRVRVTGASDGPTGGLLPLGPILAQRVELLDGNGPGGEMSFDARLAQYNPGDPFFLAVSEGPNAPPILAQGLFLELTPDSELSDADGNALTPFDFQQGDFVHIVATPDFLSGDGAVFTVVPQVLSMTLLENAPPQTVTLEGAIEEFQGDNAFTLSSLNGFMAPTTILLSTATQYAGENGEPLALADFAAGDLVRVTGLRLESDAAVFPPEFLVEAHLVRKLGGGGETFTVFGQITSLDLANDTIAVWNQLFATTFETEVVNAFTGEPMGLSELILGDFAEVTATHGDAAGTLPLALHIRVHRDIGPPLDHIEGLIQDIDPMLQSLMVAGRFVHTNDATLYFNPDGMNIGFGDLAEGQFVEIHGEPLNSAAASPMEQGFLAHEIHVRPNGGPIDTVVFGAISSISGNVWIVRDVAFLIGDDTEFATEEGVALEAGDFAVGSQVLAELTLPAPPMGDPSGGGLPVLPSAASVTLFGDPMPPGGDFVHLVGAIEAADPMAQAFLVNGENVRVLSDTLLLSQGFNPIPFGEFNPGDVVRALGFRAEDQSIEASVVRKLPVEPPSQELGQLTGHIQAIDEANGVVVVDMTPVRVTPETQIVGRHGMPLEFSDLMVGQFVHSVGFLLEDGSMVARFMHAHGENPGGGQDSLFGHISAIGDAVFWLDNGATVEYNYEGAEYIGLDGEPAGDDLSDFSVGRFVHIAGQASDGEGPFVPTRVRALPDVAMHLGNGENLPCDFFAAVTIIHSHGAQFYLPGPGVPVTGVDGEALTFEDLMLGDAFAATASFVPEGEDECFPEAHFQVHSIQLLGRPMLDGGSGDFAATVNIASEGRLAVRLAGTDDSFGFVALPSKSIAATENTLYEVKARVSGELADPQDAPTLRLRANQGDYEKGYVLVLNPGGGSASVMPTAEGLEYTFLYAPTGDHELTTGQVEEWFMSMDLASFGGQGSEGDEFRLEGFSVRPVALDAPAVAEVLARDRFANGDDGWTTGGAAGFYTLPLADTANNGSLDLAAPDHQTFGFWTKSFGNVQLQPGAHYRGRFLVRTSVADSARVPQFRLRLNSSAFQLGAEVVINPIADQLETAGADAEAYDVYLSVPASHQGTETLSASFDLINLDPAHALNETVSLEEFVLERISLPAAE